MRSGYCAGMLQMRPVLDSAHLPNGREIDIRVGVADGPYLRRSDGAVDMELSEEGRVLVDVTTPLRPQQTDEARRLVHAIRWLLESGAIQPTVGDIEPFVFAVRWTGG